LLNSTRAIFSEAGIAGILNVRFAMQAVTAALLLLPLLLLLFKIHGWIVERSILN